MWVTADFIARHYALSKSHIWKLASVHQWRRRRLGRLVEYAGEDVQRTLACLAHRAETQ